jgi:hypothetical protein
MEVGPVLPARISLILPKLSFDVVAGLLALQKRGSVEITGIAER